MYHDQPRHKICFLCTGCKQELSSQRFTSRDDAPYCLSCFCITCTNPISGRGGSKYISSGQRQWHDHCLACMHHAVSLAGRSILTCRDDILHPD